MDENSRTGRYGRVCRMGSANALRGNGSAADGMHQSLPRGASLGIRAAQRQAITRIYVYAKCSPPQVTSATSSC